MFFRVIRLSKEIDMKREFLGWKVPSLHAAARYLIDKHTEAGCLDMRSITLVLPTRRAAYRLEEILAKAAAELPNPVWYPPEFLMPESLPEKFYEMKQPVANEVTQWFGWMHAVNRLEAEDKSLLDRLLPKTPDDFESRLAVARMLARLHYELAAEGIDFKKVVTKCEELGGKDEGDLPHWAEICRKAVAEIPRWKTLATLQEFYANADPAAPGFLDNRNLWDLQSARLFAVEEQSSEEFERIRRKFSDEKRMFYLVGLADMNQLQKGILEKFEPFLTPLVFAPESEEVRFDKFGCLNVDAWVDVPLEIEDDQINVVWQPEQQADEVLRKIEALSKEHPGQYAAGDIVVGVPDKEVVPFLQQRFEQGDLPFRHIEGTSIRRTLVYRFLEVLRKYLKTRRFRDFAELVRHPGVEEYLRKIVDAEKFVDVLTRLDKYHNDYLPITVDGNWKASANESIDIRRDVWQPLHELLDLPFGGDKVVSETLDHWLDVIETALDRLFGNARSAQTREALDIVYRNIDALRSLPIRIETPAPPKPMLEIGTSISPKPTMPRLSEKVVYQKIAYQEASFSEEVDYLGKFEYSDALVILLTQIESALLPPHELDNAVELIGWLDIAMDDTPIVIVTGMNEGFIPSFATSDMFLPDSLRRLLGVMDNRRRSARDAYALHSLLKSRPKDNVLLIGGRRSVVGDPVIPSRFFFASQNTETVAQRVGDYFAEKPPAPRVRIKRAPRSDQKKESVLTKWSEPPKLIEEINVTDLKEYPRCPYRFYLKHVLKLKSLNDGAEELPVSEFGNLVHAVLRRFGESEERIKDSTDAAVIRDFLHSQIEEYAQKQFGASPRATIAIQIERAGNRLDAFAEWQANQRAEGKRIEYIEYDSATVDKVFLSGTVLLKGRIDRIDRDEKNGDVVIWDYKTSKTETDPSKDRTAAGEWVDFQLPLYHHILRTTGMATEGKIRVGYLYLSRDRTIKPKSIQWEKADIDGAVHRAEEIIQELATKNFEPPDPPPKYCRSCKELEFLCQDWRR